MDPTEWLRNELTHRQRKNAAYSLRSFARFLDVTPGRLSEFLARKRPLTPKQITKFAERLAIHPADTADLIAKSRLANQQDLQEPAYKVLDEIQFEIIADPIHPHVMSAMELNKFDGSARWIASKIGSDVGSVRNALENLEAVGLCSKTSDGSWKISETATATNTDVPNAALRSAHRKTIEHALVSLDEVPVELRDITSITMAIDPSKLPEAKKIIRDFRRKLARVLEVENKSEVYELTVQLVPVSKKRSARI